MTPQNEQALDVGPQSNSDTSFRRAMRLFQSKWRVSMNYPVGVDRRGKPYGNYLTAADAQAGRNFLTEAIFQLAKKRMEASGVEPFRCLHNLLSSQPMAFNLFGPLCQDDMLAKTLLDPLLPGGVEKVKVQMEWAPTPKASYLNDATSFDVVAHYTTRAGESAVAGIEVKLSEPFSPKRYGYNDHHADRYLEFGLDSIWKNSADPELSSSAVNQIWRTHLLAQSIQKKGDVKLAYAIVLHHSGDQMCDDAVRAYRDQLTDAGKDTLLHITIGDLTQKWARLVSANADADWLARFRTRYPDPL